MSEILIVSLDIPFPDNYGGAKDIWQRLRLLHRLGHRLHLIATYREENRRKAFETNAEAVNIFANILFFPISSKPKLFSIYPFGVAARELNQKDVKHVKKMLSSTHFNVVEIEGIQSIKTFEAIRSCVTYEKSYVRAFNCESSYQFNQAKNEKNPLKRAVYLFDAFKYWLFERFGQWKKIINGILFISEREIYHKNFVGVKERVLIGPTYDHEAISPTPKFHFRKNSLIYVGNLRLADNRQAILDAYEQLRVLIKTNNWILYICGLCDEPQAFSEYSTDPNIRLFFNLPEVDLQNLIEESKVAVCFSENTAGTKLKLIDALKSQIPVLANRAAVVGSMLDEAVILVEPNDQSWQNQLQEIMNSPTLWEAARQRGFEIWKSNNDAAIKKYARLHE